MRGSGIRLPARPTSATTAARARPEKFPHAWPYAPCTADVAKALASRKAVHVIPLNSGAKPTLTYLDATTPAALPEGRTVSYPVDTMRPLAKGVTWVGGLVLAALTGTFVRQLIKSSEKEDEEIAAEKKSAVTQEKREKEDNA